MADIFKAGYSRIPVWDHDPNDIIGLILATALHTFFNILIITTDADRILTVFLGVWVGIIFVILIFERIKLLRPPAWWEKIVTSI